jgi:hypothetical protein
MLVVEADIICPAGIVTIKRANPFQPAPKAAVLTLTSVAVLRVKLNGGSVAAKRI